MKPGAEGQHASKAIGVLVALVLCGVILGGGILWSGAYRGSDDSTNPARQFETTSIHVAWDPSVHENVAGYKVLYGTESGKYTNSLSVGNDTTTATLLGLTRGTRYYVVVVAVDALQNESPPSNEIEVVPVGP